MKCPRCQKENTPEARFCIFCGNPLSVSEATPQTGPSQESEGTVERRLRDMEHEIRRLRELIVPMNARISALEQGQPAPRPSEPNIPAWERIPAPGEAPAPPALEPTVPSPLEPTHPPPPPKPAKVREWDQILGGNWLARIGVIALIFGVGFFLKYAFDNNWLGPTARVILGIIGGLAMLGGGFYWRKRYPTLAQALSGGGIALLYLSFFAAFVFFHLITAVAAIILLLLVSAASAVLALRHNSLALAIIGILGAFIAPFILGAFNRGAVGAIQGGNGLALLIYILIVDLGVIALSTFRNWQWFTLLALVGSLAAWGNWYDAFSNRVGIALTEGSLTVIFLIFVGATMLYHLVWRRASQPFDYVLMVGNAAAYFGISLGLMWGDLREWMGGFTFLLALFYGGFAYLASRRGDETRTVSLFALGIALVFLTVAIPIQLGDRAWATVAWAAEFIILLWLSLRFHVPVLRAASYAVFVFMVVRLLFFDTSLDMRTFRPILNERVLAFVVGIVAAYLGVYLLRRSKETLPEWAIPASTLLIAASFLTLWLLSFEAWNAFETQGISSRALRNAQNLSLTAIWAVYAVVVMVIGIVKRSRQVRLWGLGLLAVPILKVFVYDVWALQTVYRIVAFVGLGLLLLASAYLFQRYSASIKGFITKS